jgi:hypothetical protein
VGAFVSSQYFRFTARGPGEPRRSLLLEQLLARAEYSPASSDWRADAFQVIAPSEASMPAVAAAALCADRGPIAGAWVCLASPVLYVAETSNVRLPAEGVLALAQADAETLALDFNTEWNDAGVRMICGRSGRLYCLFDRALDLSTRDPADALGQHIEDYLPTGPDAPRLRRLMSEIEMWLFTHELNGRRAAEGSVTISGLWLWAGGAPLTALPEVRGWAAGDDVFFSALVGSGALSSSTSSGSGASSGSSAVGAGQSGSGIIIVPEIPGSDAWHQAESRWLKPAVAQLRRGRIAHLYLSGAQRCYRLTVAQLRRFWRRRQPWWESFA